MPTNQSLMQILNFPEYTELKLMSFLQNLTCNQNRNANISFACQKKRKSLDFQNKNQLVKSYLLF